MIDNLKADLVICVDATPRAEAPKLEFRGRSSSMGFVIKKKRLAILGVRLRAFDGAV